MARMSRNGLWRGGLPQGVRALEQHYEGVPMDPAMGETVDISRAAVGIRGLSSAR